MITYRQTRRLIDAHAAFDLLASIETYYPGLSDWFVNKALPDIMLGEGVLILAEENDRPVGVALGRRGPEPKLRCVRCRPELAGRGLSLHLIDRALTALDCDKPAASVAEELIHDYSRILVNRYSFSLDYVAKGLYRPGRLEYLFNDSQAAEAAVTTPYGLA